MDHDVSINPLLSMSHLVDIPHLSHTSHKANNHCTALMHGVARLFSAFATESRLFLALSSQLVVLLPSRLGDLSVDAGNSDRSLLMLNHWEVVHPSKVHLALGCR